jgi:hypothetical protein
MKSLFMSWQAAALAAAILLGMTSRGAAQAPGMPASPLAGGMAAAQGNQSYVDAHGNPIVLPASYCQNCSPYGGGCPDGQCYGDSSGCMDGCSSSTPWADYGGCSYPDQSGPHYFDIAVFSVFLTPDRVFKDVQPFASAGNSGARFLDPNRDFDDYEAGWAIAGRYDLGPLSLVEATYMGIYDIGFHDTVLSTDVSNSPFGLDTVFSNYGLNPIPNTEFDAGSAYSLQYKSTLQSAEVSYRRYWVGYCPRVSGTLLAGFRYIQLTEDLNFDATANIGTQQVPIVSTGNLLWASTNDFAGGQFGGDVWVTLRQGLRLGTEGKVGIYNNRYTYQHSTSISNYSNVDFAQSGNQVAFAGQSSIDLVADILPSFSLRGGYQLLYLSSLVTVGNNIDPANAASTAVLTQADAVYHGFHIGLEYIW